MMRRSVRKRAGFELDKVAPLDVVGKSYIAALFGVRPRMVSGFKFLTLYPSHEFHRILHRRGPPKPLIQRPAAVRAPHAARPHRALLSMPAWTRSCPTIVQTPARGGFPGEDGFE